MRATRRSFFGVGPRVVLTTVCSGVVLAVISSFWPSAFAIPFVSAVVCEAAGAALLVCGVALYGVALRAVRRAYKQERLITTGVYGVVRHPAYAAWIDLIIPGVALLTCSWLVLGASVAGYAVLRSRLDKEEEPLVAEFGQAYEEYRRRVPAVVPWLHARRRRTA
jgi:protein-S-isoprenylcysteine O-methyltransferase Ste14